MPVAAIPNSLTVFQCQLIGTWENKDFPGESTGGPTSPYSFCVMPLPQEGAYAPGYILKNFSLFETVEFAGDTSVSLPATAPNRGNNDLQIPTALFYAQQVYFAEGPGTDNGPNIVHVENGAWLNLERADKLTGPYPPPPGSGIKNLTPSGQPVDITIAKQMSVPHGNSILALGSYSPAATGKPTIPPSASTLPTPSQGVDLTPYNNVVTGPGNNYQNPSVEYTKDPNQTLREGIGKLPVNSYIHWAVSTGNQGATMNIPFEQSAANVSSYSADYWLLSTDGGSSYGYLAYSQLINMVFTINHVHYTFPHVTTNIVTKTATGTVPKEACGLDDTDGGGGSSPSGGGSADGMGGGQVKKA